MICSERMLAGGSHDVVVARSRPRYDPQPFRAMSSRATVSPLLVRRILAASAILGADPREVAAAANVPAEALVEPSPRLPQSIAVAVWAEAERHTRDPDFGLHCAELARRTPANALAFAVATSPTFARALDCIARYARIAHDALQIRTRVEGDLAHVEMVARAITPHRHGVEFSLAQVALIGRE